MFGRLFEQHVHKMLLLTRHQVLSERDIINKFGNHITAIDHMIDLNNVVLCVQDKFQQANISISQLNHFTHTVNCVSDITNKKCIGIYLSKSGLSKPCIESMSFENSKNKNYYKSIYSNSEDELLFRFALYLYDNNLYLYEENGDIVMLDIENKRVKF